MQGELSKEFTPTTDILLNDFMRKLNIYYLHHKLYGIQND